MTLEQILLMLFFSTAVSAVTVMIVSRFSVSDHGEVVRISASAYQAILDENSGLKRKQSASDKQIEKLQSELDSYRLLAANQQEIIQQQRKDITELQERVRALESLTIPSAAQVITILGIFSNAPGQDALDFPAEKRAIYNSGLNNVILENERVTQENILREVGRTNYSIVEIGMHMSQQGSLIFFDGTDMPAGWWGRLARQSSIRLFILMACESDQLADALIREGVPAVIRVSGQLPDRDVSAFTSILYSRLAQKVPLRNAYESALLALPVSTAEIVHFYGRWDALSHPDLDHGL